MNETNNNLLTTTGPSSLGYAPINTSGMPNTYSGNINAVVTTAHNSGIFTPGTSTINSLTNQFQNNMRPTQVKVAVFTIKRDVVTNEIISTTFVKELWIERKNGTSLDLLVAKQLDKDFDPENTIVREIYTVSF